MWREREGKRGEERIEESRKEESKEKVKHREAVEING